MLEESSKIILRSRLQRRTSRTTGDLDPTKSAQAKAHDDRKRMVTGACYVLEQKSKRGSWFDLTRWYKGAAEGLTEPLIFEAALKPALRRCSCAELSFTASHLRVLVELRCYAPASRRRRWVMRMSVSIGSAGSDKACWGGRLMCPLLMC